MKKLQSISSTRLLSKQELSKTRGGTYNGPFLPPPGDD